MKIYTKDLYKIYKAPEFIEWIKNETLKSQLQIDQRISNITTYGYFGDHKDVGNGIFELRWVNGRTSVLCLHC